MPRFIVEVKKHASIRRKIHMIREDVHNIIVNLKDIINDKNKVVER